MANVLFYGFIAGTVYLLFPFADAIIFGIVTAYILYHLEATINRHVQNPLLTNSIVFIMLFVFIGVLIYGFSTSITVIGQNIQAFLEALSGSASFVIQYFDLPQTLATVADTMVQDVTDSMTSFLVDELRHFPWLAINLFMYTATAVYFYMNASKIREMAMKALDQFDEDDQGLREMIVDINNVFRQLYVTNLGVAVLSLSSMMGIFWLLGLDFWWGWAVLVAIFNFLPLVKGFIVYIPLGMVYIALDEFWIGMLIIVFGLLLVDLVAELIVRSWLPTPQIRESATILLFGFIGGVLVLGVTGIITGPLVLMATKNFLLQYYESF